MKNTLLMVLLFLSILFGVNGQQVTKEKDIQVSNYEEVLSEIEYPQICREKGIEGKVIVLLEIDEEGNIIYQKFISYSSVDLMIAVEKSLQKFRFKPAMNETGQTIASRITMPVKFKLTI